MLLFLFCVFFLFYSQRAATSTEQRVVNSFPPSWYLFLSSECANTRRTHRGLRRLGWKIANEFSTRKVPTKAKRATGKRRRVPWTVLYCYAFRPSYPPDLFLARAGWRRACHARPFGPGAPTLKNQHLITRLHSSRPALLVTERDGNQRSEDERKSREKGRYERTSC